MAGNAEQSSPPVAFRAQCRVGFAAHQQNVRHIGDGLRVIDDRRPTIQSYNRGKRRTDAWHAALALQRLHQRRLFAHLVRPRAGLRDDVEVDAGAEDVFAQEAPCVGVCDRAFHDVQQVPILAAQIDEAQLRADGEARDHRALDDCVRVLAEEDVVLAGSRLALVAVHQHVLRLGRGLRHKAPLHARGEARATAPTQAAGLHGVDDPSRHCLRALRNGLLHRRVAVQLDVSVDVGRALAEAPLQDDDLIGMGDKSRHYFPSFAASIGVCPAAYWSRISSTFAGVSSSWKS